MVLEITDETIDDIISSEKLVIIDFYADWCGPCKMVAPVLEEISEEYGDQIIVGKLNIDDNYESVFDFRIRNVPTILFIKDEEVVEKIVGANAKEVFIEKINNLLNI